LRYFNPIGAHPSAAMGELPLGASKSSTVYYTNRYGFTKELAVRNWLSYCWWYGSRLYTRSRLAKHVIALQRLLNKKILKSRNLQFRDGHRKFCSRVIHAFEK
jgi:UDP-glucose 4-epimerase